MGWFFLTELSTGYSEEEFSTPAALDPTDLTEDPEVSSAEVGVTEAEDTELECASENQ